MLMVGHRLRLTHPASTPENKGRQQRLSSLGKMVRKRRQTSYLVIVFVEDCVEPSPRAPGRHQLVEDICDTVYDRNV